MHDDGGYSLIEVMVSMTMMTIVLASLTTFFAGSIRLNGLQAGKQVAARIAEMAVERVRSVEPSELLVGRTKAAVQASLTSVQAVVPKVTGLLSTVAPAVAYDTTTDALSLAQQAALTPVLPVAPVNVALGGKTYQQYYVVGNCFQAVSGGACLSSVASVLSILPGVTTQSMYDVVIAVAWRGRDCGASGMCSITTSTLVNNVALNPTFNNSTDLLMSQPVIAPQAALIVNTGVVTTVQLAATTSTSTALNWLTYTGLPAGLVGDSSGKISGTATTPGVYSVTATVSDGFRQEKPITFTITVSTILAIANPGDQTSTRTVADSLTLSAAFGTVPYTFSMGASTWGASGLPPGLSLNAATGKISGTPTTAGAKPVTVRVTDALGATSSATFTWSVVDPLAMAAPGSQSSFMWIPDSVSLSASGGSVPYVWSATGLPAGMSINSATGVISGTPLIFSIPFFPFSTTAKVTDAAGATATRTFSWTVWP